MILCKYPIIRGKLLVGIQLFALINTSVKPDLGNAQEQHIIKTFIVNYFRQQFHTRTIKPPNQMPTPLNPEKLHAHVFFLM